MTRAYKRKDLIYNIRICKCCGKRILFHGYDDNQHIVRTMERKSLCYDCAYWQNIIDYPPDHMEVIGDKCLRICPSVESNDKSLILGGNGTRRFFMRNDWSVFESNDVWSIGTIPAQFKEQLPPTATEISQKAYNNLKRHKNKCSARSCFDRYNCFRYRLELEQDDIGAYNIVPPKWKAGKEPCKSFINISEININH